MKTILYSNLIRRNVRLPHERKRAKLVDIVAFRREKYWTITDILVETGLIDHEGTYYNPSVLSIVQEKGPLFIDKYDSQDVRETSKGDISLCRLKNSKVVSYNKKEIGHIYDYELYTDRDPWIVWTLMASPIGLSPTKRRVKIRTKDVDKVKPNEVVLKENWQESD